MNIQDWDAPIENLSVRVTMNDRHENEKTGNLLVLKRQHK